MITVQELKRKAERKYEDFLRWKTGTFMLTFQPDCKCKDEDESAEDADFFPLVIKAETGSVRDAIASRSQSAAPLYRESKNQTGKGYTLEVETVVTRKNGNQSKIKRIYFDSEDDYLYFTGRRRETERFSAALETIAAFFAEKNCSQHCAVWCTTNLKILYEEHETLFWTQIVSCVRWLLDNPKSGLYIREVPLPVHTKFIESNKTILLSLLKCVQNTDDMRVPAEQSFEQFCGLRRKPVQVRFRCSTIPFSEITLDLHDFAKLPCEYVQGIRDIFIIENEIVYLTFPQQNDRMIVWGQGFTAAALGVCAWLPLYRLFYFGDLDEHGFQILSQFRTRFPQAESFCMDRKTLADYEAFRVKGKILAGPDLPPFLTEEERNVFTMLRSDPDKNRLEQERITLDYISKRLELL